MTRVTDIQPQQGRLFRESRAAATDSAAPDSFLTLCRRQDDSRLATAGDYWHSWLPQAAQADWINLTGAETAPNIAEIYVLDDHVRVKLEVYIGDLDKFDDLVPDEWLRDASGRPESLEERLERSSREGLQFVTDRRDSSSREVVTIEPRLRVDRQSPFAGMINPMTRTNGYQRRLR